MVSFPLLFRYSFRRIFLYLCHRPGECLGVWRLSLRLYGILSKDSRFITVTAYMLVMNRTRCIKIFMHTKSKQEVVLICCHVCSILTVWLLGRTISGNSLCHHDVLLGWYSTLHHVPDDDQQDNRQVGDGQDHSSCTCLIYLALMSASNYWDGDEWSCYTNFIWYQTL